MNRRLAALLAGTTLPLVLALPAAAHSHLTPTAAEAGQPTEFAVEVGHGCTGDGGDALPTRLVSLQIPEGVELVEAGDVDGWTTEVEDGVVTWSGGELPDGEPGGFPVTLQLEGEDGTEVPFSIYQQCDEEHSYLWGGAADSDEPASIVTIGGDPQAGHGSDGGEAHGDGSEPTADPAAGEAPAVEATEDAATQDVATEGVAGDDAPPPSGAVAAGAGGTADDGGATTGWAVGGLAVAALAGGAVAGRRRTR